MGPLTMRARRASLIQVRRWENTAWRVDVLLSLAGKRVNVRPPSTAGNSLNDFDILSRALAGVAGFVLNLKSWNSCPASRRRIRSVEINSCISYEEFAATTEAIAVNQASGSVEGERIQIETSLFPDWISV
jgi:hypothetical protein